MCRAALPAPLGGARRGGGRAVRRHGARRAARAPARGPPAPEARPQAARPSASVEVAQEGQRPQRQQRRQQGQDAERRGLGEAAGARNAPRDAAAARVWAARGEASAQRQRDAANLRWAVRVALCVCVSASLVLDTDLRVDVAHGYGIWALISVVNCSERLQGDLMRKSVERFAGTLVGSAAALMVLQVDDLISFRSIGEWVADNAELLHLPAAAADGAWVSRGSFYLCCVFVYTIGAVFARASNKQSPNWDYFFFLSVLSFDFLCIDAYQQQISMWVAMGFGSSTTGPQYRVYMVLLGALLTVLAGLLVWPTYASTELRERVSTDCARLALLASDAGNDGVTDCASESEDFRQLEAGAAIIERLSNLCKYEARVFSTPNGLRASRGMEWERLEALGRIYRALGTTLAAARGGGGGARAAALCAAASRVLRMLSVRSAGKAVRGRASRRLLYAEMRKVDDAAARVMAECAAPAASESQAGTLLLAGRVPGQLRGVIEVFLEAEERGLLASRT